MGPGKPDREAEGGLHTVFVRAPGVRGEERRRDGTGSDRGDGGEAV